MNIRFAFNDRIGKMPFKVEATVPNQGITGVYGPSGAGKTSLLRALAGLDRRHGAVTVNGVDWQNISNFLKAEQRAVGYVMQQARLFPHLSVRKNILYGAEGWTDKIQHSCEVLGIAKLLERHPETLSGGETQRVAIARALAQQPKLLLLDEPLSAVDDGRRREILPYLQRLHQSLQLPCLLVSHNLDEIAALSDHLLLMDNGKILQSGATAELLTQLSSPHCTGSNASAIIDVTVRHYDAQHEIAEAYAQNSNTPLTVITQTIAKGDCLRLQIHANDVSLTLHAATDSSILNILPATVSELHDEGNKVLVKLACDGFTLLSRITKKSAEKLSLQPGTKVYAQAKTVAVLV